MCITKKWWLTIFGTLDGFNEIEQENLNLIRKQILKFGYKEFNLSINKKGEFSMPKKRAIRKSEIKENKSATYRMCELLLERRHTDDEIIETIKNEFPEKEEIFIRRGCSTQRAQINAGRKIGFHIKNDEKLEALVVHKGKLIPYSQAPKKSNLSLRKKVEEGNKKNTMSVRIRRSKKTTKKIKKKIYI